MEKQANQTERLVNIGGWFSTAAYLLTAILKISFGLVFRSAALYTDGLNSTSDVISTLIIMIGLHFSRKPGDAEHKYGHHRIEQIATLFASFIMLFIGLQSLIDAIKKLFTSDLQAPNLQAAIVAAISIFIMLISASLNQIVAKKTNVQSAAVIAKHNVSDALTAIGAFIAIITSQWNLPVIDPLVSLLIALIILYTAFDIFKDSANSLIDGFDSKNLNRYKAVILSVDGVHDVVDIKGRMLGNIELLDITITVDNRLTVGEAHGIADKVEAALKHTCNVQSTHVHVEPALICKVHTHHK